MKTCEFMLPGAAVRYPDIGQGKLSVILPDAPAADCPVVLALHGSGRGIGDYHTVPFYMRQRDICLEYGCTFAVLQNGPDTYGTDAGVHNTALAADELLKNWTSRKSLILWATSAGGVCAFRYSAAEPETVCGIIGTFPVVDLRSAFRILASCRAAYGMREEQADEFDAEIKGKNPVGLLARIRHIPMYIAHGTADRAVPFPANAQVLEKEAGAHLSVVPDGVHGTADFRYYDHAPHDALQKLQRISP